jgi:hypothetical protein
MIRVNRRLLAWIVSIGLGCLAVGIVMWEAWPALLPPGGGLGAISVGFPSLIALPFVIGNITLSVMARRRGGRAASIGSRCLWAIGILVVVSLAVLLTPPAVFQAVDNVSILVLMLLVGIGMSLPTQLFILSFLVFAMIGSSRTGAAGHTI